MEYLRKKYHLIVFIFLAFCIIYLWAGKSCEEYSVIFKEKKCNFIIKEIGIYNHSLKVSGFDYINNKETIFDDLGYTRIEQDEIEIGDTIVKIQDSMFVLIHKKNKISKYDYICK